MQMYVAAITGRCDSHLTGQSQGKGIPLVGKTRTLIHRINLYMASVRSTYTMAPDVVGPQTKSWDTHLTCIVPQVIIHLPNRDNFQ